MKRLMFLICVGFLFAACDDDGSSALTCETLDCGEHGTCAQEGSITYCACDDGYTGTNCEVCDEGYQDNDQDGTCSGTCEALGYTCSDLGTCSDAAGTASCLCAEGYEDSGQGECLPPATGKTCDDPLPLTLGTTFTATTVGAGNELNGGCVEAGSGADLVYTFTIKGPRHVVFEANNFDTILYLRTTCDQENTELGCDDDSGQWNYARLELDLQAGTYYLVVDGFNEDGVFEFTSEVTCGDGFIYDVELDECYADPCDPNPCTEALKTLCVPSYPDVTTCDCAPGAIIDPEDPESCIVNPDPTGESCLDAIPITDATGLLSGSTVGSSGETTGSCGGEGNDQVFSLTLTERSKVKIMTSGYDTVLYLRTVCDDDTTEVVCDDDGGGWQASAVETELDPGTYYIFLDSFQDPGDYEFSWSVVPYPCSDEDTVCPGTPECTPSADWKTFSCLCPEGTVSFGEECVDDPCAPNPCTDPGRGRCVAQLPDAYTCSCEVGYTDDPVTPGACVEDPAAAEWGVVVFLNADNNLEEFGVEDLDEMTQVGSSGQVSMVVLMDLYQADGGVARVLRIDQGATTQLENYGEIDMSDWQTLRDFGLYAVEHFPARHYLFVMWDHGDGWYKSSIGASPLFKGFSNDDNGDAGEISVAGGDWARAMQPVVTALGRPIDIVAFDACLMGMWEVAEAVKPFARYLVASSETIPGTGYPYADAFAPFGSSPQTLTATALGIAMVDAYHDDLAENSTLSLTDLGALETLTTAISSLADALLANPSFYAQVDSVRQNTQWFSYQEHIDLYHFASQLAAMGSAPVAVTAAAAAVMDAMDSTIIHHQAQADYTNSHGLAIYLPGMGAGLDSSYQSGEGAIWASHSTWDEFVVDFAQ